MEIKNSDDKKVYTNIYIYVHMPCEFWKIISKTNSKISYVFLHVSL